MADEAGRRSTRAKKVLLTAGVGVVMAAAVPSAWAATQSGPARGAPAAGATARFYQQTPRWGDCAPVSATVKCATVTVPVDWAKPQGPTLRLAVVKSPGTGRGPLIVNPGGPGGSGVDFVTGLEGPLRGMGLDGYDLFSWDPRGSGRSAPLTCPANATAAFEKVDASPDTQAEAKRFEAAAGTWARACRAASGPVFNHMDAGSTARDLDVLRAVLGTGKGPKPDQKLNYLGFSYGTIIGGRYAELFPQRVGRMILDSAGHPDNTYRTWLAGVAAAKDLTIANYLAACDDRADCPFRSMSAKAARAWIQQLIRRTDTRPLRSGSKTVSQAQLVGVLTRYVSAKETWPDLDNVLAALREGEAAPVAAAASDTTWDIQNISTTCQDLPDRRDPKQVLRDAARTARTAPVFGVELTAGAPCVRWPAPVPVPPHQLHARGVPPILVVGIANDTAGPYRWNRELTAQLGNARLLTYAGIGHFAYLDSECARKKENAFLADGRLPAKGTVCAAE